MAKGSSRDPTAQLRRKLEQLRSEGRAGGLSDALMAQCVERQLQQQRLSRLPLKWFLIIVSLAVAVFANGRFSELSSSQCLVERGGLYLELTRPLSTCEFCEAPASVLEVEGMTKAEFLRLGYSDKPIVVRGATKRWKAMTAFSFAFFRDLYRNVSGALKNNRDYCQFFKYKTDFQDLENFFDMPETRAEMTDAAARTWYVGWSNCDQRVASVLRDYYSRPDFLPEDSEASVIDWIFMGYSGNGATTHLDYVQRPSWQAQIRGSKTWTLVPPPECESVCVQSLMVTVHPGDLIMLNTNRWYHGTRVQPGDLSITIGSEYD